MDCKHLLGRLVDGNILCMKIGPLVDITYCKKFEAREAVQGNYDVKSKGCLFCKCFSVKDGMSTGECSKFPGKVYKGESRSACRLYEKAK